MAVAKAESSSNRTEATFTFATSGMTIVSRVVAYMVFATCFTALACLLMSDDVWRGKDRVR